MLNISLRRSIVYSIKQLRVMSTTPRLSAGTSHEERTAAEPRDDVGNNIMTLKSSVSWMEILTWDTVSAQSNSGPYQSSQ